MNPSNIYIYGLLSTLSHSGHHRASDRVLRAVQHVRTSHSVRAKSLQSCPAVALWTAARQAPLSMGFSRQEYWSGLPRPLPGDLPDPTHISWGFCTGRQIFLFFLFLHHRATWEALSIVYTVSIVNMPLSRSPSSFYPLFPTWCSYICSLHLCVCFCFANRIICTICLDSISVH